MVAILLLYSILPRTSPSFREQSLSPIETATTSKDGEEVPTPVATDMPKAVPTNQRIPLDVATMLIAQTPSLTPKAEATQAQVTLTPMQKPKSPSKSMELVYRGHPGSWTYTVVSDGRRERAVINYDDNSAEALHAFAKVNQELVVSPIAAKGGEVVVNITFRTYMGLDYFRSWVAENKLHVKSTLLRVMNDKGTKGILQLSSLPSEVSPLPQSRIDKFLTDQGNAPYRPIGVYSTEATVDAGELVQIANDPLVFIADVTPRYVHDQLTAMSPQDSEPLEITVETHSPFLKMEEIGLKNFEK